MSMIIEIPMCSVYINSMNMFDLLWNGVLYVLLDDHDWDIGRIKVYTKTKLSSVLDGLWHVCSRHLWGAHLL